MCHLMYYMFKIIPYLTNTNSHLLNISFQTPNFDFFQKSASESGLLFLQDIVRFFRTCQLSLFWAEPLYQNVHMETGIISIFNENEKSW